MIEQYTRQLPLLLAFFLFFISPFLSASDLDEEARLIEKLNSLSSGQMTIEKVEPSEAEGVYIVTVGSSEHYVFSHGDYILIGDLYDTVRQVDVGQERSNKKIAQAITEISETDMITMGEPLEKYITVFTDTDCFYCQKFHLEVEALQKEGIQVRYLMFPRSGIGTESYLEAVSVWCSDDQADAMTVAKAGGTVEPAECENPVADQYKFGQTIGITGTPTIILQNGKVINGYAPPDILIAESG